MERLKKIRIKCPHCYEMTFRDKPITDDWRCPKCKMLHSKSALRLGGWIAMKTPTGYPYGYETLHGYNNW